MKLEMRARDLDVRMKLEDYSTVNQLKVLQAAKDLIEILQFMDKVELHITTVTEEEEEDKLEKFSEESEEVAHDDEGEDGTLV